MQVSFDSNRAQGTIEYLVIIAIVIVIALVVVSLLIGQTSNASSVSSNSQQIGLRTGAIGLAEGVAGEDANALFVLMNNTGDSITVKEVIVDNVTHSFGSNPYLGLGGKVSLDLNGVAACTGSDKKNYSVKVVYESSSGLEKTVDLGNVALECVEEVTPTGSFVSEGGGHEEEGEGVPYICVGVPLTECGVTLSDSGTYCLSQDITYADDEVDCFTITGNNIILDGNYHTISGNGSVYGVYAAGLNEIVVKNIAINDFYSNIQFLDVNYSTIQDANFSGADDFAVEIIDGFSNTITGNNVFENENNSAFYINDSRALGSNTITYNTINSSAYGVDVENYGDGLSENNIITNNTITGNMSSGIYLYAVGNSTITDNTIEGGAVGMVIHGDESNNTFIGTIFFGPFDSYWFIKYASTSTGLAFTDTIFQNEYGRISISQQVDLPDDELAGVSPTNVSIENNAVSVDTSELSFFSGITAAIRLDGVGEINSPIALLENDACGDCSAVTALGDGNYSFTTTNLSTGVYSVGEVQ